MTNPLCRASECKSAFGCAHRGPHGEMCFFETEKKLCEFLDIAWTPEVKISGLLDTVRLRLADAKYREPLTLEEADRPE